MFQGPHLALAAPRTDPFRAAHPPEEKVPRNSLESSSRLLLTSTAQKPMPTCPKCRWAAGSMRKYSSAGHHQAVGRAAAAWNSQAAHACCCHQWGGAAHRDLPCIWSRLEWPSSESPLLPVSRMQLSSLSLSPGQRHQPGCESRSGQ